MPSPVDSGASKSQAEPLGLPPGFKIGSPFPFAGLNASDSRIALDDHEFSWLENYVRIGKGRMRTAYDVGPDLYTAPDGVRIVSFFWFNIGPVTYCAVFLDDGTAVQVGVDGSLTTIGASAGQFYQAGFALPACCQWGTQYLLISNNLTANSYWIWDGARLYGAGGVSPTVTLTSGGSGYTSAPTVTPFGGAGSGAAFTATVVNGSVVQVVPTAVGSGYGPADIVQLQFSGGGADNGAILQAVLTAGTVSTLILTSGGSGYTSVPTVTLTGGGGAGATAIATLTPGGVGGLTLAAAGAGYTSAPSVIITGGGGSGATATATIAAGAVTALILTNVGTGYTTVPTVTISGGGGAGATATARLANAIVTSVLITDPGSGYTGSPAVVFTGGGGTGAAAVSVLSAGSVASVTILDGGSNFTGTPLVQFAGGGGTGAAATVTVTAGAISDVTITAAGTGYTSVPSVAVQSGINNAASGTVAMMPIGVSGSAIETFQSRVWLDYPFQAGTVPSGGTINISSPGLFTDFATSNGGLTFVNSDRFLRKHYTTMRQSNGYLYTIGDSSVSVISNVQTGGSSATTTFNSLNVDPQTGSSWRDTCQDYARTILFANPFGVFGIYGGAVTKTSKKLDPIFSAAIYPPDTRALTPSAAVCDVFSQRIYILLLTISDPFTGEPRNVMLGWDEANWTVYSQSASLIYIGTQEIDSDLQAWGTDGKRLMPLFSAPSATLNKTLQTKLYGGDVAFTVESSHAIYVTVENRAAGRTSIVFSSTKVDAIGSASPLVLPKWMEGEVATDGGSYEMLDNPIAFTLPPSGVATFGTGTSPPIAGTGIGLTMVTSEPDFVLTNLQLGYLDIVAIA